MIENAIRTFLWAIVKLFLVMSDWMYEILEIVTEINLSDSKTVTYTWLFMLVFLNFACLVRIAFVILHKLSDDNESLDIGKLFKKIGGVFLVASLSVTLFTYALQIPKEVIDIYKRTVSYDERMVPSTAVISSTAKTPVTAISSSLRSKSESDELVTIEKIDEKLNDEEGNKKIYFFSYAELLLCGIGGFVVMCVQLNIIIDVITRLFLNIFRFVIGFIPISSLIEEDSKCGDWVRDIISDTFTMACTVIFTLMVYGIMTTNAITSLNGVVRIIILTIGLMTVCKGGEIIAKYMGASNLSSGGKAGTLLLGMGAMAAIRGAGKIIKSLGGYGASKAKDLAGLPFKKLKENRKKKVGEKEKSTGKNNGQNNSKGLGGNLKTNEKNNNYFKNNNENNMSNKKSSGNDTSDSILDKSPSKSNNSNIKNNPNKGSQGTLNKNEASKINNDSNNKELSKNNDKNNMSNGKNKDNKNDKSSILDNSKISKTPNLNEEKKPTNETISGTTKKGNSGNKEFGFSRNNKNLNFNKNSGFVNSEQSGHVYKASKTLYKEDLNKKSTDSTQ